LQHSLKFFESLSQKREKVVLTSGFPHFDPQQGPVRNSLFYYLLCIIHCAISFYDSEVICMLLYKVEPCCQPMYMLLGFLVLFAKVIKILHLTVLGQKVPLSSSGTWSYMKKKHTKHSHSIII